MHAILPMEAPAAAASSAAAAAASPAVVWRDQTIAERTPRDVFMLARGLTSCLVPEPADVGGAIRRVATRIQLNNVGGRRLVINPDVPMRLYDVGAVSVAALGGWQAVRATKYKHDASYTNDASFEHLLVGYQLPLDGIHVQFVSEENTSKPGTLCGSSVADECIILAIDSQVGVEWAQEQQADHLIYSTADGYESMQAHLRTPASARVALVHTARMHQLDLLITDKAPHINAEWLRVRDLFSLVEFMLCLQRDLVVAKAGAESKSRLFVVPVSEANQRACHTLSVILALLSSTYYNTSGGPKGKTPHITIGDVTAVTNGFWHAMAQDGGVPHPAGEGCCFRIDDALVQALEINMRSMTNRSQSAFEVRGKSRKDRRPEDTQCFCAMTDAFIKYYECFWPRARVVAASPAQPDFDFTVPSAPPSCPGDIFPLEEKEEAETGGGHMKDEPLYEVHSPAGAGEGFIGAASAADALEAELADHGHLQAQVLEEPAPAAAAAAASGSKRKEGGEDEDEEAPRKKAALLMDAFASVVADYKTITPAQHRALAMMDAMKQVGESMGLKITIEKKDQ